MRSLYENSRTYTYLWASMVIIFCGLFTITVKAQQTNITDYVIFGGKQDATLPKPQTTPLAPGYGVIMGSSSSIKGGFVGSYNLVQSTGNISCGTSSLKTNIYSGGTVVLANSNVITGKIAVGIYNTPPVAGTLLSVGTSASLTGNIDVNGNIVIGSGTVTGTVTNPVGSTYKLNNVVINNTKGTPTLPVLPSMPAIKPSLVGGTTNISSGLVNPGSWGNLTVGNNGTVTLNGPGTYIFKAITSSGPNSRIVYDFKGTTTGNFLIYVVGDVNLNQTSFTMTNGADATRIYTEVNGTGSTNTADKTAAFIMSNGSNGTGNVSGWLGALWVPYAAIKVGAPNGPAMSVIGSLWSGTQVNIFNGINITYARFILCTPPNVNVNAGPEKTKALDFSGTTTLTGSSATTGVTYSWVATNGGIITSAANIASITVSAAGTYTLTVTASAGCSASDQVTVKSKTTGLIGLALESIKENYNPNNPPPPYFIIQDGYILINVIAKVGNESAVVSYLISEGMLQPFLPNGSNTLITTGRFPIANLLHLNTRGDIINFCEPVYAPLGNSGLIKNAGDTAIGSHLVRNGYDLQGSGVKIGVISDSYNSLKTPTNDPALKDIGSGDLPGVDENGVPNPINSTPVQVLLDYPYGSRSDEGRAMLQIIHDIAPKAALAFRTGFISPGDFSAGIKQLQEAGCNVIVDDITFINEPFLKDGTVAKMVDLVKSLGVTYFTSAGNFSNKSHEQNYRPVAAPAGFAAGTTANDFSGTGVIYQPIKLKTGPNTIALQWEDSIYSIGQTQTGGTKNDFDIYLTDLSGNIISGYNRNNEFGDPFEFLSYTVPNNVTELDANILITRANAGTANPRFKYIIFRADAAIVKYQAGASTIVGQANAAGAIAVGAINYFNTPAFTSATPAVASYSSIGGTVIIGGADRNKPDITAPDNVNTSVNMGPDISNDTDPFSNFRGTSAAAPHAAATAALLIEGRKTFLNEAITPNTPDIVKALLQNTALPIGASNAAGAGLIQADRAMRSFASPKPSLITIEYPSTITPTSLPTSSFTLTVNGDYFTDGTTNKSQVLFRGVPVTTNFVSSTELTATIPAFTGNPAIQVFTPPIANGDGGNSQTIQFFSIPKKIIKVIADSKTKKYGEQLPAFTTAILVNNVPLSQTSPLLTLSDIGLQSLSYTTNATSMSNVGNQYFIKPVRTFDLTNSIDVGLLEVYTYDTIPGVLTIEKLPVTVVPNDQAITYGEDIASITFRYQIDPAIVATNPQVVNIIKLSHEEFLATDVIGLVNKLPVAISNGGLPVAISNGFPIAISNGGLPVAISNGEQIPLYNAQSVTGFDIGVATVVPYTLTAQELANLSFYASEKSLQSTRQLTANTKVIDIAQQSVLGYNSNPSLTTMVNTIEPSKAKGILGAEPLSNGSLPVAISNGGLPVAISNTFPIAISNGGLPIVISNGGLPVAISNGSLPIAISNSFNEQAHRIAVIIDDEDVPEPNEQSEQIVLRSLNTVTGVSVGVQNIIPGAVLNDNYDITYGLGELRVNPATITVTANDETRRYGDPNPAFTASYTGFKYGETPETSDTTGTASLTTTAVQSSNAGTYPILASAGTLTSNNYTFNFVNGVLTIISNPCLLTRSPFTNFGSTSNPNTATSLWLNIEAKVSGQLNKHGDYLLFGFGTVTFNNITSAPTVINTPIPAGRIEADSTIKVSDSITTRYDAATNTWITKVPVGFSSTSDIFITGVIINSSNGFVKKNQANSVVKGIFYSNKSYSDQWTYGIAAYQPQFTYSSIAGPGKVQSINGNYRAGTPIPFVNVTNPLLTHLVNGGSGGGGNNYAGSTSSYDNFTACPASSTSTSNRSGNQIVNQNNLKVKTDENNLEVKADFKVAPNPAGNYVDISFKPSFSGNSQLNLFTINGVKVTAIYNGISETGKKYQKRLNVGTLPAGIYFIQLENGGKREIKKLVITR